MHGHGSADRQRNESFPRACSRSDVPSAAFFFADHFVAVDHHTGDVYAVATYSGRREETGGDGRGGGEGGEAREEAEETEARGFVAVTAEAIRRMCGVRREGVVLEEGKGGERRHQGVRFELR